MFVELLGTHKFKKYPRLLNIHAPKIFSIRPTTYSAAMEDISSVATEDVAAEDMSSGAQIMKLVK